MTANEYLITALRMNPVESSEEILAVRRAFLGMPARAGDVAAVEVVDARESREQAAAGLEAIRRRFWSLPAEQVRRHLAALDASMFPDLQRARERLRVVAANRESLHQFEGHRHFDRHFFECVKTVIVCAPRDAAETKERVLSAVTSPLLRKRAHRMTRALRKSVPDVYALEQEWFESLLARKASFSSSAESSSSAGDSGGVPMWVIWVAVIIGLRIVMAMFR